MQICEIPQEPRTPTFDMLALNKVLKSCPSVTRCHVIFFAPQPYHGFPPPFFRSTKIQLGEFNAISARFAGNVHFQRVTCLFFATFNFRGSSRRRIFGRRVTIEQRKNRARYCKSVSMRAILHEKYHEQIIPTYSIFCCQ